VKDRRVSRQTEVRRFHWLQKSVESLADLRVHRGGLDLDGFGYALPEGKGRT
jgi:hypothetical protein